MQFQYNDGGRQAAGFKGHTGDCVTRAITIATGLPYREVYDALTAANAAFRASSRTKVAKHMKSNTVRNGVHRQIYQPYLESLGWEWKPTMQIGSGCQVHMDEDELPAGRIICRTAKHLSTVINGVVHDTSNRTEPIWECGMAKGVWYAIERRRCVYGYFHRHISYEETVP